MECTINLREVNMRCNLCWDKRVAMSFHKICFCDGYYS